MKLKTRIRQLVSISLAIILAVGLLSVRSFATDAEYQTWKQSDPRWSGLTLGNLCTVGDSGCLLTSIAIQIAASGSEDASFTPGVLRNRLESGGYVSHSNELSADGNLNYGAAFSRDVSPNFYFVKTVDYTVSPFSEIRASLHALQSEGYYTVVAVNHWGHYVAVADVSDRDVGIYDPANSGKTLLSQYDGGIMQAIVFKSTASSSASTSDNATAAASDYLASCTRFQFETTINTVADTTLWTLPGTSGDASEITTISAGSELATTERVKDPSGYYWYFAADTEGNVGYLDANVTYIPYKQKKLTCANFIAAQREIPYKTGKLVKNSFISVMSDGYTINQYGNIWYHTIDGAFVSENGLKVSSKDLYLGGDMICDMTLSGANVPTSLSEGQAFSIYGTIIGDTTITSVTVGVYDSNGNMCTGRTVQPNTNKYSIHDIDAEILFDSLSAGTYTYQVSASDIHGTRTLLCNNFTVG